MADTEKMSLQNNEQASQSDMNAQQTCPTVESGVNECVEEVSPAESIAEVADVLNGEGPKDVHSMSKEELVGALREIVAESRVNAHKEVATIKQALFALRQRELNDELNAYVDAGNDPSGFVSIPDPLEQEAKDLQAKFREIRSEYLMAEEKRLRENLESKRSIIKEIAELAEDIDNINMHFPKFQELQQSFKAIKDVPATDESDIWKEYQKVVEMFYDRLNMNKELRALDFKKNLETKRELISRAKSLQEMEDVVEAARLLQGLHAEWRETGPVAKELRDEIWEEFRKESAVVNKRHQDYFESRKAVEKENEEAKEKLCEQVEAIDTSSLNGFGAWDEATEKVKQLQSLWKETGFASRKANNTLYSRFRAKCDEFFASKAEYARKTREELQTNLAKKTALCEQVESLKENTDLKSALDTVVKLQAEWKTIGGVGKKYSDEIWKRFTEACNYFFDLRKKEMNGRRNEENANLETKRGIIAKLREIPLDIDRREGIVLVKALQKEWQETGHVPFKQKDKIYAEYREICDALYEAFNASREQERRTRLESQIEGIKGDSGKISREREKLLRALDQRRQELKTYENNLGFFNIKSSAGNSMFKDMERKMNRLKEEISEINSKLRMLSEI